MVPWERIGAKGNMTQKTCGSRSHIPRILTENKMQECALCGLTCCLGKGLKHRYVGKRHDCWCVRGASLIGAYSVPAGSDGIP